MELILWRHCDAESGVPDELRRLTPRGRQDAGRMAAWLLPRLPGDCRILVAPALRAQQTAQALKRPFETVPDLGSGASVAGVLRIADWPDAGATTLVVGHQPTLGRVAAHLSTGEATERSLDKGAIVWLATPDERGITATIRFAIGPDTLAP